MDSNRPKKSVLNKAAAPQHSHLVRAVQKSSSKQKQQNNVSGVGNKAKLRSLRVFEQGSLGELHPEAPEKVIPEPTTKVMSPWLRKQMGIGSGTTFATPKPEGAAEPRVPLKTTGYYDGAELRPFEGRPGSMDAFKLPSKGFV